MSITRILLTAHGILLMMVSTALAQPVAHDISASGTVSLHGSLWHWIPPEPDFQSGPPGDRSAFQPLHGSAMPFGSHAIWLWFRLSNPGSEPLNRVLNFKEVLFDSVQLYAPVDAVATSEAPPLRAMASAGLEIPRSDWPLNYRLLALPVNVIPGTHDYFVALRSQQWPLLAPEISDFASLTGRHEGSTAAHTLSLGFVLGLLVLAIIIAARGYRHQELYAFIGFLLSSLLLGLYMGGEMLLWLGSISHHFDQLATHFIAAVGLCAVWITRALFQTHSLSPRLDQLLRTLMAGFLLTSAIGLLAHTQLFALQASIGMVTFITLTVIGATNWRRAHPAGRSYTLAICGYQLLTLPAILGSAGILPYFYWARHGYEFATVTISLLFVLAIADNIQALQRRQEQLERRAIQADEHSRAKSELLARISHEIRTPINGVLGMTDVLAQTPLSLGQHRYLEVINSSGKLLLEIVNDILDYAKIEADRIELEHIPFALDGIVTQCMAIFLPAAHEKGLIFSVNMHSHTPLALLGDPTRLQQIFNNLISNAVKFSNDGNILVEISSQPLNSTHIRLLVAIHDCGIGMAPDQIHRLFQPFSQGDGSTTRRYGGTGLGLSISRQLAQLMGGDIEADSQPGAGTRVTVHVELEVDWPVENELRRKRELLAGHRMLLIYDHHRYGDAMARYFLNWGMDVRRAADREEMRQALATAPVDVIFASSGLVLEHRDALLELSTANIPIIVLQAMFDPPVREIMVGSSARYLDAPCTITDILHAICESLQLTTDLPTLPESTSPALQAARVLIAEDNQVNRQVMAALLDRLGVDYQFAENGREAVACYQENHASYRLVLMDCEMPEMNGFDATRAIRRLEHQQRLPRKRIIAVTAHAFADGAQRCLEAGMDDVLNKPVSLKMLSDLLHDEALPGPTAAPARQQTRDGESLSSPHSVPDA